MAHYASAKHAVVGLMNSLANELALQWIPVNSIHPGNILTPMIDNEQFHRTLRPDLAEPTMADAAELIGHFHMLPVPYFEARAVSNAVLFLASDEAKYITGAALPIDAGATAKFDTLWASHSSADDASTDRAAWTGWPRSRPHCSWRNPCACSTSARP